MKMRFLSAYALLALLGCAELGAYTYIFKKTRASVDEQIAAQHREPGNDDFSGASASKYGLSFIGNVKGTDVENVRSQAILRFVNIPGDFPGTISVFARGRGAKQYAAYYFKFSLYNGKVSSLTTTLNRNMGEFKPKPVTFKYKGQDAFGIMLPHSISLTEFALYTDYSGLTSENFVVHEVKKAGAVEAFKALEITDIKDANFESTSAIKVPTTPSGVPISMTNALIVE